MEHSCKTVLHEIDKVNENLVFQEELLNGMNEELEENRRKKQSLYLDLEYHPSWNPPVRSKEDGNRRIGL